MLAGVATKAPMTSETPPADLTPSGQPSPRAEGAFKEIASRSILAKARAALVGIVRPVQLRGAEFTCADACSGIPASDPAPVSQPWHCSSPAHRS